MVDIIKKLLSMKDGKSIEPQKPVKRFVGMSANKNPVKKLQNIAKPKLLADGNPLPKSIKPFKWVNPLSPYFEIMKNDITRLFGKDAQSVKMKEEYNDFMEHYFKDREGEK